MFVFLFGFLRKSLFSLTIVRVPCAWCNVGGTISVAMAARCDFLAPLVDELIFFSDCGLQLLNYITYSHWIKKSFIVSDWCLDKLVEVYLK